jgi:DNA mismatch repair protein MutS2
MLTIGAAVACPEKTRADLEWDRVLCAFADRCASRMGAEFVRNLSFAEWDEVASRWAQGKEALQLLREGEPLPVGAFPDVREPLDRLRAQGVLGASDLRDVAQMLAAARTLRRFLVARRAKVPALFDACVTDPSLDRVEEEIAGAFDPDGTLSNKASVRLAELRSEQQATRTRMLRRMEDLMNRYEAVLQDRFITEREGRYVLPVRSDSHERFPGIVHASSASGGTLFVEPRIVIPMGNRLKMLEGDIAREELAIYTHLSSALMDVLPSLEAAALALCTADARAAAAKLAQEKDLVFPEIVPEPRLDLVAARHLLLVMDLDRVVPSDLAIERGRAMIVSGPNAGGKTVALKTMGLAALLVRAGLPIPCQRTSKVGWFDVVLSDVGDDQSLQSNLSTFSAHVQNLAAILDQTHDGALVLLDELATGTDPREGEALAAGVLDSLCRRGGAVVATTHYEGLKALAAADERFVNASVGLDLATMTPTFSLSMGVPGRSSALAVARRFGMPEVVIERAEKFLSRDDRSFEETVRKLEGERMALEMAKNAMEAEKSKVAELREALEEELARARDRDKRTLARETKSLLYSVQRAREELRAVQARLRSKKLDESELKQASRALDRVAAAVAVGGELEPSAYVDTIARERVAASELRKGARVWVKKLRAEAEIVEVLPGERVRVCAGALKLTVDASEILQGARAVELVKKSAPRAPAPVRDEPLEVPMQTRDNTCDVRGMRVDEAISMATSFLDRAMSEGQRTIFIIHGHGSGALRDAIRKELETSPYIRGFRPGERHEGGDGVSVAWLR